MMPSSKKFILSVQPGRAKTGFTIWICSLNFFLSIVGYSVAMALMSPLGANIDVSSGENVYLTWPVRAIQVLVAGVALFFVRSQPIPRLDWRYRMLIFFWVLYLARAFWDLAVRSEPSPLAWNNKPGVEFQAWGYILAMTLLPLIATIKSFSKIDFQRVLRWVLIFGGIGLVVSLSTISKQASMAWVDAPAGRVQASAMLNTISFGHLGLTVGICAFFKAFNTRGNIVKRALVFCIGLFGIYVMLKTGSRGPVLAGFVVCFLWLLTRSRYVGIGVGVASLFLGCVWLFIDPILDGISRVSPVLASRIEATLFLGDTSGRDTLISDVWDECLKNPLTGFQLDFLGNSHNIILDGVMMFGVVFGWIVLVLVLIGLFSSYKIIKSNKVYGWLGFLLVQQLVAGQTSTLFGPDSAVQCLLVVVLWISQKGEMKRPLIWDRRI